MNAMDVTPAEFAAAFRRWTDQGYPAAVMIPLDPELTTEGVETLVTALKALSAVSKVALIIDAHPGPRILTNPDPAPAVPATPPAPPAPDAAHPAAETHPADTPDASRTAPAPEELPG